MNRVAYGVDLVAKWNEARGRWNELHGAGNEPQEMAADRIGYCIKIIFLPKNMLTKSRRVEL